MVIVYGAPGATSSVVSSEKPSSLAVPSIGELVARRRRRRPRRPAATTRAWRGVAVASLR